MSVQQTFEVGRSMSMKFGSRDRRLASCVAQGRFGVVEIGTPSRGGRIRLTAERGREPKGNQK